MKKTIVLITLCLSALLLVSCGEGGIRYERPSRSRQSTGDSWTVLVYMIGGEEETENGSASQKLESIMSVDYPENINVIVQTGGAAVWHKKGVYSDYLQRLEAGGGSLYVAGQAAAANMGDYNTLSDFLNWGVTNYKSNKYMLIISGKGGGSMYGIGSDELFGGDVLTLEEISYAMSRAGRNFDLVGLDASLMGSLETASALSTYTDYLAAPQDTEDADSWDYEYVLNYLCENPSSDGGDIGKAICDGYYNKALQRGEASGAAMSVIDCENISTLNQAFDGMAGDMLIATDSLDNYKNLMDALSHVHIYGGATADEGYSNLIDLGDAVVKCAQHVGMTSDLLMQALNDTVIYRVCGENQSASTGLGFYYPLDLGNSHLQDYMNMSQSSKYKEFLRKICIGCSVTDEGTSDYTASWAWETYNNDMEWLEYQTIRDGNLYELNVSGNMDLFRDVSVNVYKQDKRSGKYVFAGKHRDIDGDWASGIFKDNFTCNLPQISGKTITMNFIRSYDGYDLYSVPVVIDGKKAHLRVKYDYGADNYAVIGAWGGLDENGMAVSAMQSVGALETVTPLLVAYDSDHQKRDYVLDSSSAKLKGGVASKKTEDGSYIFEFELTDIYGLKRYGTPVNAMISGRKITLE